jgi:hypothetical protein
MEFIGTLQVFNENGKRGNPMSLYLEHAENGEYRISPRLPQWAQLVGIGATPGKAAGDFEIKLKAAYPTPGAYDGPAWNGIKAEKPAQPKPPASAAPRAPAADSPAKPQADAAASATKSPVPGPTSPAAEAPGVSADDGSTKPA